MESREVTAIMCMMCSPCIAGQQPTKARGGRRSCRHPDAARPIVTAFPSIAACPIPAACNNTTACANGSRLCGEPAGDQRHCT
ncbi:hypothetical protein MTO96_029627 [Rhipicephalus appendiculatus]